MSDVDLKKAARQHLEMEQFFSGFAVVDPEFKREAGESKGDKWIYMLKNVYDRRRLADVLENIFLYYTGCCNT